MCVCGGGGGRGRVVEERREGIVGREGDGGGEGGKGLVGVA